MKHVLLSILISIVIITSVGLGLTIKYTYVDVIKHYHIDICHINDCVIIVTECCREKTLWERATCSVCFRVDVGYNLYLLNNTKNYSKISSGTVYLSDFCNRKSLDCYYDDRNISETLNPWTESRTPSGIIGIIMLSVFLFIMTLVTIQVPCCPRGNRFSENNESNNQPMENDESNNNQPMENIESSNQSMINIESNSQSIINIESNNDQ